MKVRVSLILNYDTDTDGYEGDLNDLHRLQRWAIDWFYHDLSTAGIEYGDLEVQIQRTPSDPWERVASVIPVSPN